MHIWVTPLIDLLVENHQIVPFEKRENAEFKQYTLKTQYLHKSLIFYMLKLNNLKKEDARAYGTLRYP